MNLVEMLSKELKDKHYTEFQKARYIYIRCCQIFSFDARWNYFTLFSEELIKKIVSSKFDIEHIDSPLVICHTFSKSILKPLLEELTTLNVSLTEGEHTFVNITNLGSKWDLDATLGDFPRVKMGLIPEGFQLEGKDFPFEEFDKELGITYEDKKKYRIYNWKSGYDYMNRVSNALSSSKCRYHYSDAAFLYNYMSYLMRQSSHTILDSNGNFLREIHFTENEEDYVITKSNGEYKLELKKATK